MATTASGNGGNRPIKWAHNLHSNFWLGLLCAAAVAWATLDWIAGVGAFGIACLVSALSEIRELEEQAVVLQSLIEERDTARAELEAAVAFEASDELATLRAEAEQLRADYTAEVEAQATREVAQEQRLLAESDEREERLRGIIGRATSAVAAHADGNPRALFILAEVNDSND